MRVVAYSIKSFEKELLIKANHKKHDITLISNALSFDTALYAAGKDAVIVFANEIIATPVLEKLSDLGIKYLVSQSFYTDPVDFKQAEIRNIKTANVRPHSPEAVAEFSLALTLALSRNLISAVEHSRAMNRSADQPLGFNLAGKTIGIIGLNATGLAAASIFKGFGCKVLGYDASSRKRSHHIKMVNLDTVLRESDVITLYAPLTADTNQLIDANRIIQMKTGVMLINVSSAGLMNIQDVLKAVDNGQISYLGMDVFEHERTNEIDNETALKRLLSHPRVILTSHQSFLTQETIQDQASQIIFQLDKWQKEKEEQGNKTESRKTKLLL